MAIHDIHDLHICVIGSGMGGLATALALAKEGFRHIDLYEAAADLGFVGAGIQLAPNMARILDRLGVWEDVARDAVAVGEIVVRRGVTNEQLVSFPMDTMASKYGYAHHVGHRASLTQALYAGCQREPAIRTHFATRVGEILTWDPRPSLLAIPQHSAAYTVQCDLLIGADGVKSQVRDSMLQRQGLTARIVDTGQAAYRIMLTREQLAHDTELLALLDDSDVTRWVGAGRQMIAYPICSRQIYNISTTQPDTNFAAAPSVTYTTRGSKTQMQTTFADFADPVQRLLALVPGDEVCEWRLRVHEPLSSWIEGQVALLGDACHPTLPHVGQGAAQAVEDAAVLAAVLARLPDARPQSVRRVLRVYEQMRMARVSWTVELAEASGKAILMADGAASAARDRQFAACAESAGPSPDRWGDPEVQRAVYGFDVIADVALRFDCLWKESGPSSVVEEGPRSLL